MSLSLTSGSRSIPHSRTGTVIVWLLTAFEALTMTGAGLSKFSNAAFWTAAFVSWGYPAWLSPVIGGLEAVGALLLLVPAVAARAAGLLIAIMAVALVTVLVHPGRLGPTAPIVHLVLLSSIAWLRWARRRRRAE